MLFHQSPATPAPPVLLQLHQPIRADPEDPSCRSNSVRRGYLRHNATPNPQFLHKEHSPLSLKSASIVPHPHPASIPADATNSRKAESLHLRNSKECLKKQKVSKCQSTKISMTFSQKLREAAILDPSWKKCIKSLTIHSIDRLRRINRMAPTRSYPDRGDTARLCAFTAVHTIAAQRTSSIFRNPSSYESTSL